MPIRTELASVTADKPASLLPRDLRGAWDVSPQSAVAPSGVIRESLHSGGTAALRALSPSGPLMRRRHQLNRGAALGCGLLPSDCQEQTRGECVEQVGSQH